MKVEEEYEEKKGSCQLLEEELNSLKQECAKTEQNLTAEITELRPHSEQLKVSNDISTRIIMNSLLRLKLKRNEFS